MKRLSILIFIFFPFVHPVLPGKVVGVSNGDTIKISEDNKGKKNVLYITFRDKSQTNNRDMGALMPLFTVFLSGLFALLVAVVTWWMNKNKEKTRIEEERFLNDIKERELLYASLLAFIEDKVNNVISPKENAGGHSLIIARIHLIAPETIHIQIDKVMNRIVEWATEYEKGKGIPAVGGRFVSMETITHSENSKEIFALLMNETQELIKLIKLELSKMKVSLNKNDRRRKEDQK
jgi:hypothetical protein